MSDPSLISAESEQTKSERVYQNLRRRIREMSLPPGAPLRKEEIAAALNVSRAPVSEAIARLADEALVDVFPQHGSFVSPIRAHEIRESLLIRTALEVETVRRVAVIADDALMRRLDKNLAAQAKALKSNDLATFYDLDEALHALIFAAIESPRAQRLLDAARAPLDRPRRLLLPDEGRPEATLSEHRMLVDAIRSREPEFAAASMRSHLSNVARTIEQALSRLEDGVGQHSGTGSQ